MQIQQFNHTSLSGRWKFNQFSKQNCPRFDLDLPRLMETSTLYKEGNNRLKSLVHIKHNKAANNVTSRQHGLEKTHVRE